MSEKKRMIKDVTGYSISSILTQLLSIIRGIVVARFLGPALYGIFNLLRILLGYSQYSQLGMLPAMSKEIPYRKGRGEPIENIKNIVFTITLIISLIIGLGVIVFSFLFSSMFPESLISGLRIVSVLILLQQIYFFYSNYLRAVKEFIFISIIEILMTVINFALTILFLIYGFSLNGILVALMISYVVVIIYIIRKMKIPLKLYFEKIQAFVLLRNGLPLLLIGIGNICLDSIDKLMIAGFYGTNELGLYSISAMIIAFMLSFSSSAGSVMFPSMMEQYGKRRNEEDLKNYLMKPLVIISCATAILIGIVFIAIPMAVQVFLPKYILGVDAIRIVIFSTFFIAITSILGNYMIAVNKERIVIAIQFISIGLTITLNYITIMLGYGLTGIAMATVATFAFYSTCILFISLRKQPDMIKIISKLYFPLVYVIGLVVIMEKLINPGNLIWTISELGIFAILCLPLIIYINRETSVISEMFSMAKKRIKI
ncbi:MAG: oligosaccharide flippase family protein [Candidatus Aenigmarchaeota archaeon]|nr:oligosaccharide flippase family protein [Candidatus Aenigmarchaeota archaeon]